MTQTRLRTCRSGGLALAVAAALACPAPGGAAEPPAPPAAIGTTRPPPPAPKPAGVVQFDAYRGFHQPGGPAGSPPPAGPGQDRDHGPRGTPLEIGVAAGLATCADGNTAVGSLDVGGWRYQPEDVCAESSAPVRGSVTLRQDAAPAAPPPAPAKPAGAAPPRPPCDPASWRCGTGGR